MADAGLTQAAADGGDEGAGVYGRGGGDLRGVRHQVDAGGCYAGDGFQRALDMDLAGGAGHALNAQRVLA